MSIIKAFIFTALFFSNKKKGHKIRIYVWKGEQKNGCKIFFIDLLYVLKTTVKRELYYYKVFRRKKKILAPFTFYTDDIAINMKREQTWI